MAHRVPGIGRAFLGGIFLLLLAGGTARAQVADSGAVDPCASYTGAGGRVCQAASDVGLLLHPTLGLLMSGGNPVLGTASAMGRFGAVLTVGRATVVHAVLPDPGYDGAADTVAAAESGPGYAPRLDLSLGILSKTLTAGTVTADLLGSVVLIPTTGTDRLQVEKPARSVGDVALGFGFGLRIGFRGEGSLPEASLTIMKRDLPRLRYGSLAAGDSYTNALRASAINVRLLVGKRFSVFNISGGAGVDLYGGDAQVTFRDPATGTVQPTFVQPLSTMRIITVLSGGIELPILRIGGEVGFQVGKDDGVVTNFRRIDPAAGKFFGGFGIGLRF